MIFVTGALGSMGKSIGVAVLCLLVAAIAGFNLHVVRKTARLLSEEEWLRSEIRKEELRRELATLRAAALQREAPHLIEGPPP